MPSKVKRKNQAFVRTKLEQAARLVPWRELADVPRGVTIRAEHRNRLLDIFAAIRLKKKISQQQYSQILERKGIRYGQSSICRDLNKLGELREQGGQCLISPKRTKEWIKKLGAVDTQQGVSKDAARALLFEGVKETRRDRGEVDVGHEPSKSWANKQFAEHTDERPSQLKTINRVLAEADLRGVCALHSILKGVLFVSPEPNLFFSADAFQVVLDKKKTSTCIARAERLAATARETDHHRDWRRPRGRHGCQGVCCHLAQRRLRSTRRHHQRQECCEWLF